MFEKYLRTSCTAEELLRFNYKAIISCYYYDNYNNYSKRIILNNIDLSVQGYIGLPLESLISQVKESLIGLSAENIEQVITNIVSSSYSASEEYVSISPEFIIQCTGKQDCKGALIYEGDVIEDKSTNMCYAVIYDNYGSLQLENMKVPDTFVSFSDLEEVEVIGNLFQGMGSVL